MGDDARATVWDVDFLHDARPPAGGRALIILNQAFPRALVLQLWRACAISA